MAGSHAGSAHNAAGHALVVASHPPAIPVSRIIVADGQQVVEATGRTRCVIDRAVNALALASALADQDWGGRCRLDDHEPHGLESFAATSDAASLATAQQRVAQQVEALHEPLAKGEESTATGQSKRLEQRQQALVRGEQAREAARNHQAQLGAPVDA